MDDEFERELRASLRRHAPRDLPSRLDATVDRTLRDTPPTAMGAALWRHAGPPLSAAFGALALILVALFLVTRPGGEHPAGLIPPSGASAASLAASPAPTSSMVSPAASPSGSPLASMASSALIWARAYQPTGISFTAASADGGGFLAVGADQASADTPTTWQSTDGLTWSREPASSAFVHAAVAGHIAEYVVHGLGRHAQLLVAVGADQASDQSAGSAFAWYSTDDGRTWTRANVSGASNAAIYAVTWSQMGWVAVGANGYPGMGTQLGLAKGPAVWRSSDGRTWTRITNTPTNDVAIASSVVVTPAGGYVAAGTMVPSAGGEAIWTSTDGTTWKQDPGASFANASASATSHGVFAGGATFQGAAAIAETSDGRTWRQTVMDPPPGAGTSVAGVAELGPLLIAIGIEPSGNTAFRTAVWTSTDGRQWTRAGAVAAFENAVPQLVTAAPGRLLVTGQCDQDQAAGPRTCVWVAPAP